jgi:hypothetical protein
MVIKGKSSEVEKHHFGFINIKDIDHSFKIYFEIRKQKSLEPLDNYNNRKALKIFMKHLKILS